ncbi:hypothetical protein ABH935_003370 [Catenulispora sp. GAS73]|uniref:hypothetical protein n=1 Tax=Catenulispora sp. GAS73 TaxID=3156269 RepID=UPI0035191143
MIRDQHAQFTAAFDTAQSFGVRLGAGCARGVATGTIDIVWVLVSIADTAEGRAFARLREGEIGIGHESALIVALSQSAIIADLRDVVGLLQQYHGPEGAAWLSREPTTGDEDVIAHYHRPGSTSGAAYGLNWVVPDGPAEKIAAYSWFDQDERSIYLADAIATGALPDVSAQEYEVAALWQAYAAGTVSRRPPLGLREDTVRTAERAYVDELRAEVAVVGEDRDRWHRLGEIRPLPDGSALVVEREESDGGWYAGCYVVSRYPSADRRSDAYLIERTYLRGPGPD